MKARRSASRRSDEGVALILVLSVLASLMVLAAPFLIVAVQDNQGSITPLARAQANAKVDGALAYARYRLENGHAGLEAINEVVRGMETSATAFASPKVDGLEEVSIRPEVLDDKGNPLRDADKKIIFGEIDPRGVVVDLDVQDDHARPNIWSSPPFLIAGSLGRSVLTTDLKRDDTDELRLEDASRFPKDGGRVLVNGEVITYQKREGSRLVGLGRGADGGLRARLQRAESWVIDDRARLIAMIPWKSPRARGGWREPVFPGALKEIALFSEQTLTAVEVDRLARDFSFAGKRWGAGGFGPKVQILRRIGQPTQTDNGYQVGVAVTDGFNPGTVVRVTDGENVSYGMVAEARGGVRLFEAPGFSFEEGTATIQALMRHPVNINTATPETLERMIIGIQRGLGGRARGAQGRIDGTAASLIVQAIETRRPLLGLREYRELIEDQISTFQPLLNDFIGETIFRNAVDANNKDLAYSTVPFSFASFDHYTLTASASIQDGSGRRLAQRRVRERVHVAPPGLLEVNLENQEDFEQSFVRARRGRYTITHPLPVERYDDVAAVPASRLPRMLLFFGSSAALAGQEEDEADDTVASGQGGVWPSRDEGDVRLMPVRTERAGNDGALFGMEGPGWFIPDDTVSIDRIDPEGYRLERQPFTLDPRDSRGGATGGFGGPGRGRGRGGNVGQNGALQRGNTANPVRVDFWVKTPSGGGGTPFFDYVGEEGEEDRIQLLREGEALIARIADRTLDDETDDVDETMEIRYEPENGGWKADTWYHLGLAYRGSKPWESMLFVDGMPRGKSKFASRLQGGIGPNDTSFELEEAEGWPQTGVVQVGPEVIAYKRSGNSFEVISLPGTDLVDEDLAWGRGQRGTKAQDHPSGAMVSLFGYSILPRGAERRERNVVPAGGGRLGATLGPMRVATIASNTSIRVPGEFNRTPVNIDIEVFDETAGGVLTLLEDGSEIGGQDFDCFPEAGGYALIVSRDISDDFDDITGVEGVPLGGFEFVRFDSRSGNQLFGVRAAPRPGGLSFVVNGSASGANALETNRFISTSAVQHPVSYRVSGRGVAGRSTGNLAAVFPVSIPVDQASRYKRPETPRGQAQPEPVDSVTYEGNSIRLNYPQYQRHPEFVQVGVADPDELENNQIEWIRYTNIDPNGHLLCDEEVYLLRVGDLLRSAYLGQPWYRVELASVSSGVEDPDDYERRLWDGANPADMIRMQFPFRRQCGTDRLLDENDARPARGTEVVPCIRTYTGARRGAIANSNWTEENRESPLKVNLMSSVGWGDRVTLEQRNGGAQKVYRVAWAGAEQGARRWLTPYYQQNQQSGTAERIEWENVRPIPGYDGHGWIAFTTSPGEASRQGNVPNSGAIDDERQRSRYLRLLKFPSGELPDMGRGSRAAVGGDVYGTVAGTGGRIDEVRISAFDSDRYVLWDNDAMALGSLDREDQPGTSAATSRQNGIDATTDEIPMANVRWNIATPGGNSNNNRRVGGSNGGLGWYMLADGSQVNFETDLQNLPNNDAGLILIGEEIIAFRGIGQSSGGGPALLDCERGFLGTQPSEHAFGTPVTFLDFMPVTMLRDGVEASGNLLAVNQAGDFPRNGGTILVGDEMIHYTQFGQGGFLMPRRLAEDGVEGPGLFRGRYGTVPRTHDVQAIVVGMPFRYWDRYVAESDSGELSFYEVSLDLPGAWIHDVAFERSRTEDTTEIEVLVRLDPSIPWEADPKVTDGLFRIEAMEEGSSFLLNRSAESFEARVFFRYESGAFDRDTMDSHGWKSTPVLENFRVRYLDQTRVLSREVIR